MPLSLEQLPIDVVRKIRVLVVKQLDIDTRRALGVPPGRLRLSAQLERDLAAVLKVEAVRYGGEGQSGVSCCKIKQGTWPRPCYSTYYFVDDLREMDSFCAFYSKSNHHGAAEIIYTTEWQPLAL